MFDEFGGTRNLVPWIERELNGGSRLMGFGHRVYRTRGPRADILKDIVGSLDQSTDRMQFAEALERAVLDALAVKYLKRRLDTNVEYYTVLVLDGVGLRRELFTPAFAMGRVFGWCAPYQGAGRGWTPHSAKLSLYRYVAGRRGRIADGRMI